MRVAVRRKIKQAIALGLLLVLLVPSLIVSASSSRYAQSGTFNASGSPMLNPNFTTDQWNKWEMVAWGVFLSNFVVPMADTYETAFSTSSTEGSRGSGFKALNFSQAADPGASGILQNFTQFAIDEAMNNLKDLEVTYYYIDQAGNLIEPMTPGDLSTPAIVVADDSPTNPTTNNIQPLATSPANFTSLLPVNLSDIDTSMRHTVVDNNVSAWIAGTKFGSNSFDDVFGVNGVVYRPWGILSLSDGINYWPNLIAIPPAAGSSANSPHNTILTLDTPSLQMNTNQFPKQYAVSGTSNPSVKEIAVAKLPIIWLKGADGKYVRIWDMLDPWDYQVLITMLAKEINSDSEFDSALGTTSVWEVVAENIDKAFEDKSALKLDCFGNIVTLVGGKPLVVIPAAYNKHITTKPMVNLVNSLFLTGPTSGVSGQTLLDKGKMPVKSFWWRMSNENETTKDNESNFGPGMPAFGWKGATMPTNAVALYYDSDTLAYKTYQDRVIDSAGVDSFYLRPLTYEGFSFFPHMAAILGVLDLDIAAGGNKQYTRTILTDVANSTKVTKTDVIVPKLTLTGISKVAGLGKKSSEKILSSQADKHKGVKSLMIALTFQEGITGLLPASYNEIETEYVQKIIWQESQTNVLGNPVVVPVAMQAGTNASGKMLWSGLARDFISYYGTEYYPTHKRDELHRLSKVGENANDPSRMLLVGGTDVFEAYTSKLMYDEDTKPSLAIISHSKTAKMAPYIDTPALAGHAYLINTNWGDWLKTTGFIWRANDYIRGGTVDTSWWAEATGSLLQISFASMTQRWVKAYPTNRVLTSVASYLGMRGDSEFAAAAAPYVYLSYLDIYGVGSADGKSGVNVTTLNKNPTKFNENIYDAKSSPLFTFEPTSGINQISDADKAREVTNYAYELLSPLKGREYKRQLLSNIVGNLLYDQYTKSVYGGSLEYRSGGVQQVVTRSQTGFLRFPSLEDNVFTRWFYEDYATVALVLLALGMVLIIVLGVFRGRKFSWFIISTVLLVTSVVVIPFVNDIAATSMDGLVSKIMKDKTTLWSMTEMIANSNMETDFISSGLTAEEADMAASITKSMSIAYTDRSLMLKQDISHKVVSLGNFEAFQQFASTRWMLPSILRQFTADDGSASYLYIPLQDVVDDAANAYWWYNPDDAKNSDGIAASDLQTNYAIGTGDGFARTEYTYDTIKQFYPNYHWRDTSQVIDTTGILQSNYDPTIRTQLSYRSLSQSVTGSVPKVVPIHDYIYMYMNNAYDPATAGIEQVPVLPVYMRPPLFADNANNKLYWGDYETFKDTSAWNVGSYQETYSSFVNGSTLTQPKTVLRRGVDNTTTTSGGLIPSNTLTYSQANIELIQLAQKYIRDERDTMYGEFAYLWSTETPYPYFYALVKDTMDAMGRFDYSTGMVDNTVTENAWRTKDKRLGLVLNSLTGVPAAVSTGTDLNSFYGATRRNFMYQSGVLSDDLVATAPNALLPADIGLATSQIVHTGYVRDVLDLESMFYNVIPYMYQMTLLTGGLTGEGDDTGLFGEDLLSESQYRTYKGLPHSWLYRCNWATKIVEAPAYNKPELIGYYVNGVKKYAEVTMTYFPAAYRALPDGGRDMIFSEAQLKLTGLSETDLTTLELKLIKLNTDITKKWTKLINYVNTGGMTAEVMCRQMALEAMLSFNEIVTPSGLGNTAYALTPSTIDLRSLSFDTIMRVVLLNTSKDTSFFGTDAMESTITEFGMFSGVLLLFTTWVCVYGVTVMRAFFLAFLFLMGVYGVARGVFASNSSKKATLFGYLSNIGILYIMSYFYYQVFNILMMGADSQEYVNSGLKGSSASPTVAIIIILVVSLVYIWAMFKMFRIALGAVISGSHDLGYGVYKDKARAGMNRVSRGIRDIQSGHTFEDLNQKRSEAGSFISGVSSSSSSSTESSTRRTSRRTQNVGSSGTGSGARALQGNNTTRSTRNKTALDDYESVDSTIARGGTTPTASNPAMDLDDYLSTPKDDVPKGD